MTLKSKVASVSAISISKGKSAEWVKLRTDIQESTAFLPEEASIATRIYCILNDLTDVPLCKNCGGKTVANKVNNRLGFSKFCSIECSRSGSDLPDDVIEKLSSYDWMYTQRIVNKMSWDDIAGLLGCSHVPVRKWSKIHQLPEVDYNKSSESVSSVLSDEETLRTIYKSGKSIYDISEDLGCSPSHVSVWLNRHGIEITPSNAYPRKHVKVSAGCMEVIDFIESVYEGEVIINDRSVLKDGRELDIFVPEKNFAIEYNGVWSHQYRPAESSASKIKDKEYHRSKFTMCRDAGIKLMTVWSCDWDSKQDIIKSMICTKLGAVKNRIHARKCDVRVVTSHAAFFDVNHIQGRDRNSFIAYGLFDGDELVACMSFAKSRYNKNFKYELSRFACKKHFSVPGAFSRLLKAFRNAFNGSIISYADCDHSNGEVYRTNGFQLLHENPAAYWYVAKNSEVMEHRFKYRKSKISLPGDTRTEDEIMRSNGYFKVFDCGMLAFGLH